MSDMPKIVVLCGGTSEEREVSLASGEAIASAIKTKYRVELVCLDEEKLPSCIQKSDTVVFPALHGGFGEGGQLQALLEEAGVEYCGSGPDSSRLCLDKVASKTIAHKQSIPTPEWMSFDALEKPLADDVIRQLGSSLVVKPVDQGSSVGLHFAEHRSALGIALSQIHTGRWMIERRIRGRELTVGLLGAKALGAVEIVSASGVYDYEAKYSSGTTKYLYPAQLERSVEIQIKDFAERLFGLCACRDFARIDFLLEGNQLYFLEVNTLPGLTATSLLPKSASCVGYDFVALAEALVAPALHRLANRRIGEERP